MNHESVITSLWSKFSLSVWPEQNPHRELISSCLSWKPPWVRAGANADLLEKDSMSGLGSCKTLLIFRTSPIFSCIKIWKQIYILQSTKYGTLYAGRGECNEDKWTGLGYKFDGARIGWAIAPLDLWGASREVTAEQKPKGRKPSGTWEKNILGWGDSRYKTLEWERAWGVWGFSEVQEAIVTAADQAKWHGLFLGDEGSMWQAWHKCCAYREWDLSLALPSGSPSNRRDRSG